MNFFEFYEIPISFKIDKDQLKKKYLTLSKKYHPDFFTLEDAAKQEEALGLSTKNNNAYKTLRNFDLRMKYILEIYEVISEEGQNKLPQEFLLEMMDINEQIMDLQMDFDLSNQKKIIDSIDSFESDLHQSIQTDLESFSGQQGFDFSRITEYYLKKKYLKRLKDNISNVQPEI